jgi:NADPH:quinone reductase-like Zn-dependent oxidoreductase
MQGEAEKRGEAEMQGEAGSQGEADMQGEAGSQGEADMQGEAKMMRAMVLRNFGDDLVQEHITRPTPAANQVLVRVAASGVNPLDIKIRKGEAAHAQVSPPAILGIDLAGIVEEVGANVDAFHVGDEVYGMTGGVGNEPGSLAEYSAVDADLIAIKPQRLSMAEASALPLAAISAWEGLIDRAGVSAGQNVLVHGGAGGVGSIAVQLATSQGATVYATGSARSAETIRELGAHPIDRDMPVADVVSTFTDGNGFDIVFDAVGGHVLDDSFAEVRRYTGHVVSILGWGTHSLAPLSFRGASYSGVFTLLPLLTGQGRAHHGEILAQIAALVDAGTITPRLSQSRYGWSNIGAAHDAVGAGATGGKVVIDMES